MAKVGTAYIEIVPDLTGFAQILRAQLAAIKAEKEVEIKIDRDRVVSSVRDAMNSISQETSRGMARVRRTTKSTTDNMADNFKKLSNSLKADLSFGLISGAITAIAGSFGPLVGLINSTGAAALAMGSAFGSAAAGGMAAFGASLVGLVQTVAVAKTALGGLSTAMDAQTKVTDKLEQGVKPTDDELADLALAMSRLSPAGREMVGVLNGLKGPMREFRNGLQETLLSGVAHQINILARNSLPVLKGSLDNTAQILNDTAKGFLGFMQNAGTLARLKSIADTNNGALATMSQALVPLTNAFLILQQAMAPLVQLVADYVLNFANAANTSLSAKEKTGELSNTVRDMKNAFVGVVEIVKNFGRIIKGAFEAAKPAGQIMLQMLQNITDKWADWVNSSEGQKKIFDFAMDSIPVMQELGRLIGDIFKMLGEVGKGADTVGFIESIREVLPVLGQLLAQFSNPNTVGAFADAIKSIGEALVAMNAGGMLAQIVTDMAGVIGFIANLVTSTPGATSVVGSLVTAMAGFAALRILATVTGVSALFKAVGSGIEAAKTVGTFTQALRGVEGVAGPGAGLGTGIRTLGQNIASFGSTVGSNITKASQWAAAWAQTTAQAAAQGAANIGRMIGSWVQLGIQQARVGLQMAAQSARTGLLMAQIAARWALAQAQMALTTARTTAMLVLQKTATMAIAAAQKAWTAIQWLLNAAMSANPLGIIIIAIIALVAAVVLAYQHSETFRNIVQAAFRYVAEAATFLWDIFKSVFGFIVDLIKSAWSFIWESIKFYWDLAVAFIGVGIDAIKAYFRFWAEAWQFVKDALLKVWSAIRDGWDRAVGAVRDGVENALAFFRNLPGQIWNAISGLGSLLYNLGADTVRGLWNGIQSMGSWLMNKLFSWVKDVIPGPIAKALGIGSPSKVTAEQGKEVARGLVVGMDKGTGWVEDEATQLAKAAIPPVKTTFAPLSTLGRLGSAANDVQVALRVFIGDRDITDIVRVEIDNWETNAAYALSTGRRGGF